MSYNEILIDPVFAVGHGKLNGVFPFHSFTHRLACGLTVMSKFYHFLVPAWIQSLISCYYSLIGKDKLCKVEVSFSPRLLTVFDLCPCWISQGIS